MKGQRFLLLTFLVGLAGFIQAQHHSINWVHISSETGGIEAPNGGGQQTSSAVADFDNNGLNDFCISERTNAPAMVWYQRNENGWKRFIVEDNVLFIEAGTTVLDIDGDGIQDIVGGGMWFKYLGNNKFAFNTIDGAYTFSRSATGQLIKGGRPEVIFVVGDGWAPMYMYEYQGNTWVKKGIIAEG